MDPLTLRLWRGARQCSVALYSPSNRSFQLSRKSAPDLVFGSALSKLSLYSRAATGAAVTMERLLGERRVLDGDSGEVAPSPWPSSSRCVYDLGCCEGEGRRGRKREGK